MLQQGFRITQLIERAARVEEEGRELRDEGDSVSYLPKIVYVLNVISFEFIQWSTIYLKNIYIHNIFAES